MTRKTRKDRRRGKADDAPDTDIDVGPFPLAYEWRTLIDRCKKLLSAVGKQQELIVPAYTIAGRALIFVTAIMCFLACLSLTATIAINEAARKWINQASQEVTIQIKPTEAIDQKEQIDRALRIIKATPGIISGHVYDNDEMAKLLQPWLGHGFDLEDMPIPRLIAIELDPATPADLAELARALEQEIPGATLDDHQIWKKQILSVANWFQLTAILVLILIFGATNAIIIFATSGAMASNRDIVEVLHLVGAPQQFIVKQFEHHFMLLGLKGGLLGATAAALILLLTRISLKYTTAPSESNALLGSISIGWESYVGILGIALTLSLMSALTSRMAVYHYLKNMYQNTT